jgi:uncharacterized membrane protein (DUF4010 family)
MDGPDPLVLSLRFAAALGLGVMLGLERERTQRPEGGFAGVRTFGLISLAGAMAAYLDASLSRPWLALAVFAAIAGLVIASAVLTGRQGDVGITTEVSALLAFLLGFLCVRGQVALAAGLAVASGGMLALKNWLHALARRIESADVEATLKFAIVSIIILPLVPDQDFGPAPLDVINPHTIWWMVVLISGLNFASYLLVKILGPEHGVGLTGLLGGLVSSTAVTLGFAQRSRSEPEQSRTLALGMVLAWTVMFFRVVLLVALAAQELAVRVAWSLAALGVFSLAIVLALRWRQRPEGRASVRAGANPFELGEAIRFGLLFGVVTFAAKAAQLFLGDPGLYLAGAVAGLTDVDAIALSMAQLSAADPKSLDVAARTVVIAVLANTLAKGGMAVVLGAPALRRIMLPITALLLAAGVAAAALLA